MTILHFATQKPRLTVKKKAVTVLSDGYRIITGSKAQF